MTIESFPMNFIADSLNNSPIYSEDEKEQEMNKAVEDIINSKGVNDQILSNFLDNSNSSIYRLILKEYENAMLENELKKSNYYFQIQNIGRLKENWDGYNANAPLRSVVNNSLKFVICLMERQSITLNEEDITPTPYGNIVFDIYSRKGLISIEIGSKQIGFFTDFAGGYNYSSDGINTDFNTIPKELNCVLDVL